MSRQIMTWWRSPIRNEPAGPTSPCGRTWSTSVAGELPASPSSERFRGNDGDEAFRGVGTSAEQSGRLPPTVAGPPAPERGREQFFGRREVAAAYAWALARGLAILGDIDVERPIFRVLGQLTVLLVWGRKHRLGQRSLRSRSRRIPRHFEVTEPPARELAQRARSEELAVAERTAGALP